MLASNALLRDGTFLRLWAAQAVSAFGARITREGLPLAAILSLNADPRVLGGVAALAIGPSILVGLASGGFVDRSARRTILIASDMIRAAVLMTIPVAAWLHFLSIGHLYAAAALVGGANALFEIAAHAYLPGLIGGAALFEGNTKLGITDSLAEVGGPAIAGLLFQALTVPLAILVNVATYLVSAISLFTIERPEQAVAARKDDLASQSGFLIGWSIIFAAPAVRAIFAMNLATNFFGGFFATLYSFFALRILGLSPVMLGLTIAAGGLGSLLGAVLAPLAARGFGVGMSILVALLGRGLFALVIPLAWGSPQAAMAALVLAQFGGDALMTAADISATSVRQSALPLPVLGRTAAAFQAGAGSFTVAGALAGGFLAAQLGARVVLSVAAAGLIVAPAAAFFSVLRKTHRLPIGT